MVIFMGELLVSGRVKPLSWPLFFLLTFFLVHKLMYVCTLMLQDILLQPVELGIFFFWGFIDLRRRKTLFQGTIGCTPNSVPMVFTVFSRDSWGL